MTKHRVFIYTPNRPGSIIREVEVEILVREKQTWALAPSGKRYLLGSTAFYSLAAANRAKRGALQKVLDTPFLARNPKTMGIPYEARMQLDFYEQHGGFPRTKVLN